MNRDVFAKRREALRARMYALGLDALLISYPPNRFYVSGFELHDSQCHESAGHVCITAHGHDWLCTDSRYADAAKRLWDQNFIFIYKHNIASQLRTLLQQEVGGRIGVEQHILSANTVRALGQGLSLHGAQGLVEQMRLIKEPDEIAALQRSAKLNHRLMEWLYPRLTPGRTEAEISWDIEVYFREHGATELAFSNIVATGKNAALPHYSPGPVVLPDEGPVLIDVGARVDNYCSDQSRTFWVGNTPTPDFMVTMQIVRTAQEAVLAQLRPGMTVSQAYAVAYNAFAEEGVQESFTHALGHGIGLATHEAPSLNPHFHTVIKPGMVMTVEPGLYYPEWGGVRRECMVLVEEDGVRIL